MTTSMAGIISDIGSLVTGSVTWIGSAVSAVMNSNNALLLFFVLIGFCSIGFGLLRRFFA